LQNTDAFTQLAGSWHQLAGDNPFRALAWLSNWWKHYSGTSELFVLVTRDENDCVRGILPAYLQHRLAHGRELRLLGDGEVCSDHLGLLVSNHDAHSVAASMVDWLVQHRSEWDRVNFESVDADDLPLRAFAAALHSRDCSPSHSASGRCWAISLPNDWDEFLAMQSKSHRKQLRQADRRVLSTPQARWHLVSHLDELHVAWPILVDLHQQRRQSLGESGCFASPRFTSFHRAVCEQLLLDGRLRLSWLELQGRPVAAEYHIVGGSTLYCYQGGVDPRKLDLGPGQLSLMACLQSAIAEGRTTCDLMRGDEPYKSHWRAAPRETFHLRASSPRTSARLRESAVSTAGNMARWIASTLLAPTPANHEAH
jgi:CelD/BcsL family acetyltransferase involved in cellulose biosynthesis